MGHLIKKMTLLSFLSVALGNISQASAGDSGAILMCASDPGSWVKAHVTPQAIKGRSTAFDWLFKDKVGRHEPNGDVWVYGVSGTENSNNPTLRLMDSAGQVLDFPQVTDKSQRSAKDYCAALRQICEGRYVAVNADGLGAKDLLIGTVSMYQEGQVYTCPNWRVNHVELSDLNSKPKYHVTCMDPSRAPTTFSPYPGATHIWTNGARHYNLYPTGKKDPNGPDANFLLEKVAQPYCAGK